MENYDDEYQFTHADRENCDTILANCGLTREAVLLARSEGCLRDGVLKRLDATRAEICAGVAQITRPTISEMNLQNA